MIYKIRLEQLKINPFEQKMFDGLDITKEHIEDAIFHHDIFHYDRESIFQKHIRSVAYVSSNYNASVAIELNSELNIVEGIYQLAAAVVRGEEFILIKCENDKKIKEQFELFSIEDLEPIETIETIDWASYKAAESWGNIEYVLPKLKKAAMRDENLQRIVHNIPRELWFSHGKDLVIAFSKKLIIPEHVVASPEFLHAIKDSYVAFGAVWLEYYKNKKLSSALYNAIQEQVFNDPAVCLELLTYSYKLPNIYQHFSDNVKIHPDIIRKLYQQYKKNEKLSLASIIPKSYFSNISHVEEFLKHNKQKFSKKEFKHIFEGWINDKKILMNFINNNIPLNYVIDLIPEKIKNDKEFLMAYLPQDKEYTGKINKELFDNDLINLAISHDCASLIPTSILLSVTDKETIKEIIKQHCDILSNESIPQFWLEDLDIISQIPIHKIHWLSHDIKRKYLSSEENCINYLNDRDSNIDFLSPTMLKKQSIALAYLKTSSADLEKIYPALWSNKDFCINASCINLRAMDKIPVDFFNEKEFLIKFAKKLDKNEIESDFKIYLPNALRNFLEEKNIKHDYEKFFTQIFIHEKLDNSLENKKRVKTKKI